MIFAIPWGGRGGGGSGRGGGWDDGGGGGGRDDDDEDVCGGGGSGEVLRAKSLSDIFKNVELHRKGHFFRIILTGNAAEEREAGHYSRPSVRPSVRPPFEFAFEIETALHLQNIRHSFATVPPCSSAGWGRRGKGRDGRAASCEGIERGPRRRRRRRRMATTKAAWGTGCP